ncbi:hypothetical protein B0H19DRAFT_1276850 [Mycena capillaripes]|nr:hypothetical protein B0H19DRAFT_1276850 [Mycena capillaripes]
MTPPIPPAYLRRILSPPLTQSTLDLLPIAPPRRRPGVPAPPYLWLNLSPSASPDAYVTRLFAPPQSTPAPPRPFAVPPPITSPRAPPFPRRIPAAPRDLCDLCICLWLCGGAVRRPALVTPDSHIQVQRFSRSLACSTPVFPLNYSLSRIQAVAVVRDVVTHGLSLITFFLYCSESALRVLLGFFWILD